MAYATSTDLCVYFGYEEVAQRAASSEYSSSNAVVKVSGVLLKLTIDAGDRGSYSADEQAAADNAETLIDKVLADATEVMNAHLRDRYTVPVTNADALIALRRPCCDIARCYLYDDGVPDYVADKKKAATAWLKSVRDGEITLLEEDSVPGSGSFNQVDIIRVS